MKYAVLVYALILASCHHAPVTAEPPIKPLPQRPLLPVISAGEMQCLSDETYTKLATREWLRRQHIELLELIITGPQQEASHD